MLGGADCRLWFWSTGDNVAPLWHSWRRAVQLAPEPGMLQRLSCADPQLWVPTHEIGSSVFKITNKLPSKSFFATMASISAYINSVVISQSFAIQICQVTECLQACILTCVLKFTLRPAVHHCLIVIEVKQHLTLPSSITSTFY